MSNDFIQGLEFRYNLVDAEKLNGGYEEWTPWNTLYQDVSFAYARNNIQFRVKPDYEVVKKAFVPGFYQEREHETNVVWFVVEPHAETWRRVSLVYEKEN